MKKLITLTACAMLTMGAFAQTIEINPLFGTAYGGGASIDVNNDGRMELIFGGNGRANHVVQDPDGNDVETPKYTWLMGYNAVSKTTEEMPTNILNADRAHFIVEDFNGDGIMDLLASEHNRGSLYGGGIYQGNGDGTFNKVTMNFTDPLYKFTPVAVAAADFNNDAKIDIVAIGYETVGGVTTFSSSVLINQGDYNFEVTNSELLSEYKLALATVKVIDYNNDGFMDFIVSANCDNPESNGNARVLADVFANLGTDGPGQFYRLNLGSGTIFQKANGGLNIADFNADGWMDFAIHGEGGQGTGEPLGSDIWQCNSHLYVNLKNGSFADKAQPNFLKDVRPLNSSGTGTGAIDWNGDGSYDLFIPGWNPAPESGTQAGYMLMNDGLGTFGAPTRVPGASEVTVQFPDWNGDGIKDYWMNGQSWDSKYFTGDNQGRTQAVMINDRAFQNERPSAPTGLSTTWANNTLTLSWNAATDKETPALALTYEYFIKNGSGKFVTSCRSFVGGDKDGIRKTNDLGNAQLNKTIKLTDLPTDNYTWGVQAIDASYDGSTFATSSFKIVRAGLENNFNKAISVFSQNGALMINADLPADVQVFTANGIRVFSAQHIQQLNQPLATGVYIVKSVIDNQNVVRKVTIK